MSNNTEFHFLLEEDFKKARQLKQDANYWYSTLKTSPELIEEVALNKHLPNETLNFLAQSDCPNVRLTVAMKNRLPPEVYQLLVHDADDSVRMAIARNTKTPIDILSILINDDWDEISNIVKTKLDQVK